MNWRTFRDWLCSGCQVLVLFGRSQSDLEFRVDGYHASCFGYRLRFWEEDSRVYTQPFQILDSNLHSSGPCLAMKMPPSELFW